MQNVEIRGGDRLMTQLPKGGKVNKEKRTVSLPTELYDRIDERAKATEFDSVDDYVIFVLEEVLKEEGGEEGKSASSEEEVKKRLRALGYPD